MARRPKVSHGVTVLTTYKDIFSCIKKKASSQNLHAKTQQENVKKKGTTYLPPSFKPVPEAKY